MFTKLEQRYWIKIEVARGHSTQECFQGLCETCGEAALPYRTVTRQIKVFREGRDAIKENLRAGGTPWRTIPFDSLFLCWLLIADELAAKVGLCHKTVLSILGYHKLAERWIPHEISEVQQWHRQAVTQALLDRYQREGDDFLGRIVTVDETWARSYETKIETQSNEWKHPGSPRPKKVRPTQCAVKMIIVACDIEEVILHHDVQLCSKRMGRRQILSSRNTTLRMLDSWKPRFTR